VHRSVLQNKSYIRFAAQNTVEVICMEEIDKAVREKPSTIATYKFKDAYGDVEDYLVEFGGLTLEELKGLSNTTAVVAFMEGGKIPYTAIVDPHTGKAIEAMKGKPTVKSLSAAVLRARKILTEKHGRGISRKQWNALGAAEVSVDLLLADGKHAKAIATQVKVAAQFKRPPAVVKNRLDALRAGIEKDVANYLDACEKKGKLDSKARAHLATIARALGDTPLAKRAVMLAKG